MTIGIQYKNGIDGILEANNNHFTAEASLAVLVFFTLMVNTCRTRGLNAFYNSLVEWNYRVFEKHLKALKYIGGWEAILTLNRQKETVILKLRKQWFRPEGLKLLEIVISITVTALFVRGITNFMK